MNLRRKAASFPWSTTSCGGLPRPSWRVSRPGTRSTPRPSFTKPTSAWGVRRSPISANFCAAAVAMQRILVDHARRKRTAKRGGLATQFTLHEADRPVISDPDTLLDIDAALSKLAAEDAASADVARFRLFAGLSIDEAAAALGLSRPPHFANGPTPAPGSLRH